MVWIIGVFVNLYRFLRNAGARLLRRPADYIWIPVTGPLPEFEAPKRSFLRRRLDPRPTPPTLETIRQRLDHILSDGRPRGVVLRIVNLNAGWAAVEELREEISRFRSRGKKVVAYLVDPDTSSYYLASAADEVFTPPSSTLNVVGLRVRVNFLKNTLSRLGLKAEVLAVSPYKSAGDVITRSDFSRESREQVERLLDRRFEVLVDAISTGRRISPERVRDLIDRGPFFAPSAVEEGLLDGALYEDQLGERLGSADRTARFAEWGVAKKALRVPYWKRTRKVVGLVDVRGTITRGRSRRLPVPLPLVGGEQAGSDSVVAALRVAEKSRRIGAVLLHVDSRGGDALASDLIWREVERIRPKKPVVVLMGNAAASGGYYIAAAASHIVARKNTLTGSIGVILARPVASGLLDKLGVNPVAVERGARANLLDPSRTPSPDELEVLNRQLHNFYDEFKDRVSTGRNLESGTLEEIAGGRVWTGAEASRRGLVDEIGGFRAAFKKARELAGIPDHAPDILAKIALPGSARPSPGEPVTETVEAVQEAYSQFMTTRVWALDPYEISDDW